MSTNYLPRPDTDFAAWMDNFDTYANAHLADLGLLPADGLALANGNNDWKAMLAAHVSAAAAAQSARQAKDASRASLEGLVRQMVRALQASSAVDDSERAALGITVPDTTPTPIGPIGTVPVARLESPTRLRHIIHFADSATPTSKAKPPGAMGAEIWISLLPVGQPTPTDPASFTLVALDTRTPYTLDFQAAEGGKNAHYLLRWVSTKGDKGPWSETASATVGA